MKKNIDSFPKRALILLLSLILLFLFSLVALGEAASAFICYEADGRINIEFSGEDSKKIFNHFEKTKSIQIVNTTHNNNDTCLDIPILHANAIAPILVSQEKTEYVQIQVNNFISSILNNSDKTLETKSFPQSVSTFNQSLMSLRTIILLV